MNENIIKQPPLPNAIQFHTRQNDDMTEVMRITRDGVWVNPDIPVDETAKAVLDALSSQIQVLVQRAEPVDETAKDRLIRIMGTFDLATGHADTLGQALDALEEELRDVLGHLRARQHQEPLIKKEWVGLTTSEVIECQEASIYDTYINIEAKLKEKNVPQP